MRDVMISLLFLTVFVVELYLGALITLSFQGLVSTRWILSLEEILKKILLLRFLIPILLIVLFIGRSSIYPWVVSENLSIGFPRVYFNSTFFILRNLFYLLVWFLLTHWVRKNKYGGLVLVFILFTGALWSFDWVLSLTPHFKSTTFGLVFLTSGTMAALGLSVLFTKIKPTPQGLQDINNVHFTLIGSWLYLSFVQFQIIWSGNLPDEAHWYLLRSSPSWKALSIFIVIFQCVVPLFSLLLIRLKSSFNITRFFAGLTFFMQILVAFWLVLPAVYPQGMSFTLFSVLALLATLSPFVWMRRFA